MDETQRLTVNFANYQEFLQEAFSVSSWCALIGLDWFKSWWVVCLLEITLKGTTDEVFLPSWEVAKYLNECSAALYALGASGGVLNQVAGHLV